MEEVVNNEATPPAVTSKPIKKRAVVQDDRDRDDYDAYRDGRSRSKHFSSRESPSLETKARRELLAYLSSNGIEATRELQNYEIVVKLPKSERHSDNWRSSTKIVYTSPDGEVYTSKADVLDALKALKSKASLSHAVRTDVAAAAQKKFNSFMRGGLPADVENIKVVSFGVIDSEYSSFHNCVEIYPIGYKVELYDTNRGRSGQSTNIQCEILSRNNHPEFKITKMSTGQAVSASSEASAWKKVTHQKEQIQYILNILLFTAIYTKRDGN